MTSIKKYKKERVAGRRIGVYKVVWGHLVPYGFPARYKQGFIYRTGQLYDDNGVLNALRGIEMISIKEGFHSYSLETGRKSLLSADFRSLILVKFYIPKGACYYLNEDGEYVSDQIYCDGTIVESKK